MNKSNILCWIAAVAIYGLLVIWGNREPIELKRGSRSAWAEFWQVAEKTPVPVVSNPQKPQRPPRPPPPDPPKSLSRTEVEGVIAISACTQHASVLAPKLRRSIRVSAVPVDEAEDLPRGVSRMAAPPDVPPDFQWPRGLGQPLALLAQVNLSDVKAYDEEGWLPETGWLCFFYALGAKPAATGMVPADRAAWAVVYFDGSAESLHRATPPKPMMTEYPPCRVRFWKEWTLPSPVEAPEVIESYNCQGAYYADLCAAITCRPKEPGWHHLGGYAQDTYTPMREYCQLASSGTAVSDDLDPDSAKFLAASAHAREWKLLFEVEPEALLELEPSPGQSSGSGWTGSDRLYFWIREADLKARDFSRVWMLRQ